MDPSISTPLQSYYDSERATLATGPAVRAELQTLGVVRVYVEYDGVGDSGQVETICYFDGADPAQRVEIDDAIDERVEDLLYALLELRHGGWENNGGGNGSFNWNLIDGTLKHEHHQRYTDYETFTHMGFEIGTDVGDDT